MERIFISGLGFATCLGNDRDTFWKNLTNGVCGIDTLQVHDTTGLAVTIGGEIREIDNSRINVNDLVSTKKMDRASQFAVLAAHEALEDAGLPTKDIGEDAAVIIGAGLAGLETYEFQMERLLTKGPDRVSPFTIPMLMPNAPPGNISLAFGIQGTAYTTSSACSSSGHAMIDAIDYLRNGKADFVVTGGTEASLTRLGIASFSNMKAMCRDRNDAPKSSMRPFDADRSGFIMAEGSSVLIFETESHLRKRGGKAWAEVLSGCSTSDSFHLVQPDPEGRKAIRAITKAIEAAGLNPSEIADETYVSAHGTSTQYNDSMETVALKAIFGDDARKLQISSIKSMLGHMIGAACAVEMSACCMALTNGLLPPTINYETPDPSCDLNYVPNKALEKNVRYAINNSFGFGGHNVSLVLKKVDDESIQRG
ncbi:MAG: beta-ketoacyl-[acyl-carrier-protein] synthase family protein [Planctomycetaceae bacterium]|nr:beta-ketoacyl-[acyl-carrier-protein] synthase family protein [Planctomycetaceae bacterium]